MLNVDRNADCLILTFSGDTGLTRLIFNDNDDYYRQEADHSAAWCDDNLVY